MACIILGGTLVAKCHHERQDLAVPQPSLYHHGTRLRAQSEQLDPRLSLRDSCNCMSQSNGSVQIRTAVNCLPSLLILDNLHLLAPAASEAPEAAPSTGTSALVSWLCQVLDAFRETKAGVPPLPGPPPEGHLTAHKPVPNINHFI